MRAAFSDYRTRVRFSWEGTVNASESKVLLDDKILIRNLAKNPVGASQTYFSPNNPVLNSVIRNQVVPAPHPLNIGTCVSSELLISNNDILSMYNVDGRLNTDSFTKWCSAWVWSEIDCVSRIRDNSPVTVSANTWTLVNGIVQPGQYFSLYVSRSGGKSEVGMKAFVTGVTSVLSPDIPPCFSGESKDIDRIRIADWYAGLTDDQRLASIAGPPVMQVAAPTRWDRTPGGGLTLIGVGRYVPTTRNQVLMYCLGSGHMQQVFRYPNGVVNTGNLCASGSFGSIDWAWHSGSGDPGIYMGLGRSQSNDTPLPWNSAFRGVYYDRQLTEAQIMLVVRWLAQQLPL